jgi:hypothetical protein
MRVARELRLLGSNLSLSFSVFLCVAGSAYWRRERGEEGVDEEPYLRPL